MHRDQTDDDYTTVHSTIPPCSQHFSLALFRLFLSVRGTFAYDFSLFALPCVSQRSPFIIYLFLFLCVYLYLLFVPLNLHIRFNIIWRTIRIRNKWFALCFSHHVDVDALSYSYFLSSFILQLQRAECLTSSVQNHTVRPNCWGHSETIFGFYSCTMLNIVRTKKGRKKRIEKSTRCARTWRSYVGGFHVLFRVMFADSTKYRTFTIENTIRIFASGEILKMKWKPTESQIYCTFCQKRFAHLTDGVQSTPLSTFSHILNFWCWCSWHSTHYYSAYVGLVFHSISGTHWMPSAQPTILPRPFEFILSILGKTRKKMWISENIPVLLEKILWKTCTIASSL